MPRQFDEDGGGFELLPEGCYRVQLREIQDKQTKTGRTQWMFEFEVLDGEQENGQPFLLFARTWPNQNGFLDAFDPQRLWAPDVICDPQFDVDSLCGQYFDAEVKHREFNSKTYANVVAITPHTAPPSAAQPAPQPSAPLTTPAAAAEPDYGDPFAD
jgi:hypothetical protein